MIEVLSIVRNGSVRGGGEALWGEKNKRTQNSPRRKMKPRKKKAKGDCGERERNIYIYITLTPEAHEIKILSREQQT